MSDKFNILDYTDGSLLKSGQTTDFTPAGRTTKDDGGFQRGIAGSKADAQYDVLTTGQYAGTTNITVNAIVDAHTNACVFDKVTGLMWNRELTPAIYGIGTEHLRWDDTAGANEDIFNYCDSANLSQLSGFSDWRIPNIVELNSLLIYESSFTPPLINNSAFPVWTISTVYTSTTRADGILICYAVNFTQGRSQFGTKTVSRIPTVLVRLGIE